MTLEYETRPAELEQNPPVSSSTGIVVIAAALSLRARPCSTPCGDASSLIEELRADRAERRKPTSTHTSQFHPNTDV
jgi:hypothetical protein